MRDYTQGVKEAVNIGIRKACIIVQEDTIGNIDRQDIIDTGRLKGSISYSVDEEELSGEVGTNVEYAAYNEYGTVKMKARPYLRPALNKNRKQIVAIIRKEVMDNFERQDNVE